MRSIHLSVIDSKSYLFYVDSNYLFVSRQNFTDNSQVSVAMVDCLGICLMHHFSIYVNDAIVQLDRITRRFYVSTDFDGADTVTFKQVQLPAAHWQDVSLAGVGSVLSVLPSPFLPLCLPPSFSPLPPSLPFLPPYSQYVSVMATHEAGAFIHISTKDGCI